MSIPFADPGDPVAGPRTDRGRDCFCGSHLSMCNLRAGLRLGAVHNRPVAAVSKRPPPNESRASQKTLFRERNRTKAGLCNLKPARRLLPIFVPLRHFKGSKSDLLKGSEQ